MTDNLIAYITSTSAATALSISDQFKSILLAISDLRTDAQVKGVIAGGDIDQIKSRPCPQAVLDQFALVKTPADEESGTEAVLYSEADGLTIQQAIEAAGIPKAYMIEGADTALQNYTATKSEYGL